MNYELLVDVILRYPPMPRFISKSGLIQGVLTTIVNKALLATYILGGVDIRGIPFSLFLRRYLDSTSKILKNPNRERYDLDA